MNIGIIGAGAIATYVLKELKRSEKNIKVTSLFVRDKKKYERLAEANNLTLYTNLEAFLQSPIDIVVEAANVSAVTELLPEVVTQKDVVLISVGALADETFLHEIKHVANTYERNIYLPSGAIGGLDLVQNAASVGEVKEVTLETRKPAHTLVSDPIEQEEVIFSGTALEAIRQFPKNMNVSIALALAGIGLEQTEVIMIADPNVTNNIHTIKLHGDFGHATFSITNQPLPDNPNTSYLAAMSVIGTLNRLSTTLKISH